MQAPFYASYASAYFMDLWTWKRMHRKHLSHYLAHIKQLINGSSYNFLLWSLFWKPRMNTLDVYALMN